MTKRKTPLMKAFDKCFFYPSASLGWCVDQERARLFLQEYKDELRTAIKKAAELDKLVEAIYGK